MRLRKIWFQKQRKRSLIGLLRKC